MKVYKDAIGFDLIEAEKENIQQLREGRSATALKELLTTPSDELKLKRTEERRNYEEALKEIDELDDPLQPFLDYLKWINENYPSGTTVESGLMELLERCTSQFIDIPYYKNDPRYLRVWLQYAKCSENLRDIFTYLYRKEIGQKLALYYEDFANFLETNGRYSQADDVFQEGVKQMARPVARLQRRYSEFIQRYRQKQQQQEVLFTEEPKSPIFPARSALQLKSGSSTLFLMENNERSLKRKLEVFNDDTEETSEAPFKKDGWDSLETNQCRNKENRMESKPWNGETLKQEGFNMKKVNRLTVFKDDDPVVSAHRVKHVFTFNQEKNERLDLNIDLLIHDGELYDLEEVYFMMRQCSLKPSSKEEFPYGNPLQTPMKKEPLKLSMEMLDQTPETAKNSPIQENIRPPATPLPLNILNETNHQDHIKQPLKQISPLTPRKNITTSIISDTLINNNNNKTPDKPLQIPIVDLKKSASPTSTFFTKAATDEIYSMFNQNLDVNSKKDDAEDYELMYDYTEQFTNHTMNRTLLNLNDFTENVTIKSNKEDEKLNEDDNLQVSEVECVINPGDENLKNLLLQDIIPSLSSYEGFFKAQDAKMNMCATLKKNVTLKQPRQVFVNFDSNQTTYNLRSFLGEGGYASVYLSESMDGKLRAIKAQKPASAWEFYILKQVDERLSQKTYHNEKEKQQISSSIITAQEIHLYQDESYLILDYIKKGTLLDIVNLYRSRGQQVDETLIIFITVQLLNLIQTLHSIGIIHGDLKPDNCMLRLNDKEDIFDLDLQNRGIKLIDFGRSIDMQLYPSHVQFKANWGMDEQDCPEMREGKTWTYQADYYGLASIIHTMLFGSFIQTVKDVETGFYTIKSHLKRYMKAELWGPLFEMLINSSKVAEQAGGKLPISDKLQSQKRKLQGLIDNEKSKNHLLSILRGIEEDLK